MLLSGNFFFRKFAFNYAAVIIYILIRVKNPVVLTCYEEVLKGAFRQCIYCSILLLNQMNIINLGILAHIDAGKTSVTENLLFASGATEKCGRVDNGDTITDSMDIEKRRGITVRASTTSIIWNGVKCNIIDTPGHMDFIAEVERTFKMLDGAVLILFAKEGIQAQTKLLFNTLHKLQIPTIIFILNSAKPL